MITLSLLPYFYVEITNHLRSIENKIGVVYPDQTALSKIS